MAKTPFDSGLVRSLASLLDETNLSEIEFESEGTRIRVARQITYGAAVPVPAASVAAAAPAAAPVAAAVAADPASHPGALKSPMVGVAYLAPEPGKPNFVAIGDAVAVGQTICLIEAMKTYNPIRAAKAGKITQILVEDGSPVEYGEPLVIIE
ncbi:MAG TPA: acetyl-CoA carboxylase biotin carboxyl carrier protein [Magnetospirillaceae bacterium]|nr:acetyl-CoA carboxylase biotin carboxyl carrier protein [Magnetospirillaceae bacterium]